MNEKIIEPAKMDTESGFDAGHEGRETGQECRETMHKSRETKHEDRVSDKANQVRLRYKYRRLIMTGKARLPYKAAAQMVGPDCAYHLYGTIEADK
ncbi:MAG: hypothetical protein HQK89_08795 [Nitrospirae bacterium]|nr:hypothetical protein [Nitrospirota bacterium]